MMAAVDDDLRPADDACGRASVVSISLISLSDGKGDYRQSSTAMRWVRHATQGQPW
jgi:hypothetical protein